MDIVVKGRNVEVPDHYRQHVADKLQKIERYDGKLIRTDVELFHERNPRQSERCQRVEITCYTRGPVVRAEACAADFYAALDLSIAKLESRLRRSADRRRVHRGRHAPVSVAAATAPLANVGVEIEPFAMATGEFSVNGARPSPAYSPNGGPPRQPTGAERATGWVAMDVDSDDDQPWHIVRVKEHHDQPMTVDEALSNMELVGHDFYLFRDKESGRASVVYRRHAYDYGLISLGAK